jgi:hypothetical protein
MMPEKLPTFCVLRVIEVEAESPKEAARAAARHSDEDGYYVVVYQAGPESDPITQAIVDMPENGVPSWQLEMDGGGEVAWESDDWAGLPPSSHSAVRDEGTGQ